jgi:dihydroneopterin aldolase
MKSYILLENIVFYARHGVSPQETAVGNEYIVNLKIGMDLSKAGETDNLDDTVSYAEIYEDIKTEMAIPSRLLEHVACRIVRKLRSKYHKINTLEIKLSKRNPPMGAQIDCASVLLVDSGE